MYVYFVYWKRTVKQKLAKQNTGQCFVLNQRPHVKIQLNWTKFKKQAKKHHTGQFCTMPLMWTLLWTAVLLEFYFCPADGSFMFLTFSITIGWKRENPVKNLQINLCGKPCEIRIFTYFFTSFSPGSNVKKKTIFFNGFLKNLVKNCMKCYFYMEKLFHSFFHRLENIKICKQGIFTGCWMWKILWKNLWS